MPLPVGQSRMLCVFCHQQAKLTSEHVWGQWLKPYVSRPSQNKYRSQRSILGKIGTPARHSHRPRAGSSPLVSSVKIVCADCNSGWLSRIQKAAKPHILSIIDGQTKWINGKTQNAIARWATMATITGEYTLKNLASIGVSHDERDAFRDTQAPLPGWRIWMGYYQRRKFQGDYMHASIGIADRGDMQIPNVQEPDIPLSNTQWSTFIIGKIYFHTASSFGAPEVVENWNWGHHQRARTLLVQIWPQSERLILWPRQSLTDADAWNFSRANFHYRHAQSRVHLF